MFLPAAAMTIMTDLGLDTIAARTNSSAAYSEGDEAKKPLLVIDR